MNCTVKSDSSTWSIQWKPIKCNLFCCFCCRWFASLFVHLFLHFYAQNNDKFFYLFLCRNISFFYCPEICLSIASIGDLTMRKLILLFLTMPRQQMSTIFNDKNACSVAFYLLLLLLFLCADGCWSHARNS